MTAALTSIYAYHGVQADGTEQRQKEQIIACVKRAIAAGGTGLTRREISEATGKLKAVRTCCDEVAQ